MHGKESNEWLAGRHISVNWDVSELVSKKYEMEKADLSNVRMAINTFPSS